MKITEVSADGLGVSALIAAAGKIHDLTEERNIVLGVIEGATLGEDYPVAVVMAKADARPDRDRLAVTIERNPRIFHWSAEPEAAFRNVVHNVIGDHIVEGACYCDADCCNSDDGRICTCRECSSEHHDHSGRAPKPGKPLRGSSTGG